jgi:hypothetical protein
MPDFDSVWRAAVRFRHVSRELERLLRTVHHNLQHADAAGLRSSIEPLLSFLTTDSGRTDANCSSVCHYFKETEALWNVLPEELRSICDDMSGTLVDAIYAPDIARTFDSLPEQLLERVRNIRS